MAIDREAVRQAAEKYVERRKYDKAVLEYQKIIQVDPNDARTLLKIGDLQLKMEAYSEAIATYERVGKFYAAQGFALKAIAVYKQIRDIIHRHVPGLEERYAHISPKLADLYQQLGLTSDALAALDEVATRLQRQQRDQEALAVFRRIVELDPANPLPHLRLAEALSRARDNEGAANEFAVAASQLLKHGRRDDALKVIERLLHHRQDMAQARIAAELYLARGGPSDGLQALAKLQICFQANPKDLDTLALLARAFAAIGQASKGIEVHKEMARIAREQGRADLFREIVDKLQRVAPHDSVVRQLAATGMNGVGTSVSIPEVSAADVVSAADALPIESPSPPPLPHRRGISDAPEMIVHDDVDYSNDPAIAAAQIQEILEEAAVLRDERMYPKAIETLRLGIDVDPHNVELRVALRDVLLESGRHDEAVEEMLAIASIQLDALDGDGAARSLQEALQVDPTNARAIHALRELGYEVDAGEATENVPSPYEDDGVLDATAYGTYDDPLPAYDLDTSSDHREPASVAPRPMQGMQHGVPAPPAPGTALTLGGMPNESTTREPAPRFDRADLHTDDPFGAEGPLPSFPLEAPESDVAFELVPNAADARDDDYGPPSPPPMSEDDLGVPPPPVRPSLAANGARPASRWPTVELEDALEEAEFFASRGLYDDARAVLSEQLARAPNHPLLRERMHELDMQEQAAAQTSGTRAMPRYGGGEDRGIEIATSLDALESLQHAEVSRSSDVSLENQVDVEEVFAKFKEGVSKQISLDDAQMHYDLGIAYREIGKLHDAVREFEIAARDGKLACIAESMIGMLHLELGDVPSAIDAFLRGLQAPVRTAEQETVLSFELGAAYEARKMQKEALGYYHRVARREPNYRDVQERIRRLSRGDTQAPKVRAAAVGDDDDFDRAFDEVLGQGKLP